MSCPLLSALFTLAQQKPQTPAYALFSITWFRFTGFRPPNAVIEHGSGSGELTYSPAHVLPIGSNQKLLVPGFYSGAIPFQGPNQNGTLNVHIAPVFFGATSYYVLFSGVVEGQFSPNACNLIEQVNGVFTGFLPGMFVNVQLFAPASG
jgi:hypothetical protein